MLKFLRKYKRIILGMFIVILMVAFVAPQIIQELGPNPMKAKVATLDGRSITTGDVIRASAEVRALEVVAPNLPAMIGINPQGDSAHWILLKHEAKRAGFIADANDGRDWIPELAAEMVREQYQRQFQQYAQSFLQSPEAQQQILQLNAQLQSNVERASGHARLPIDDVYRALAAARGIMRMQEAYLLAARPTTTATIRAVRMQQDLATVNALFIPASDFTSDIPDPMPEELQAHIERFAELDSGTGEFGIGYKLPARVKLEWMTIDRAAVSASIPIDRVEIRKRYDTARTTYTGEFDAERERVRQDYNKAMTDEVMAEVSRIVRAEVLKVTRRFESDGPFKVLPATWSEIRPTYESIAQAVVDGVRQSKKFEIPAPSIERRDGTWLTETDIAEIPGLGRAAIRIGNNEQWLARAVFQVKELGGNPVFGLQVGLPEIETPGTDINGNIYFFTVFDALPPAPATGPEDAPNAIEDYKSLKAYERLVEQLPVYEQMASLQTLDSVASLVASEGGSRLSPQLGVPISRARLTTANPDLSAQAFRDAVMDAAAKIDPRLTSIEIENSEHAVLAVAVPERRGVIVAKITGVQPTTIESYRQLGTSVVQAAVFQEIASHQREGESINPFSFDLLIKRHNYKSLEGKAGSDEEA